MAKITKEEMKKWLSAFECRYYSIGLHHPHLIVPVTERDKEIFKAIMDAIENMDKKVSKEFVEKWTENIRNVCNLGFGNIVGNLAYLLKEMLIELGHEVEEER